MLTGANEEATQRTLRLVTAGAWGGRGQRSPLQMPQAPGVVGQGEAGIWKEAGFLA